MQNKVDKVILIFGGAGGIGAVVAARLASKGTRIVIADLDAALTRAKAADLVAGGGQAIGVACDIAIPTCANTRRRLRSIDSANSTEL